MQLKTKHLVFDVALQGLLIKTLFMNVAANVRLHFSLHLSSIHNSKGKFIFTAVASGCLFFPTRVTWLLCSCQDSISNSCLFNSYLGSESEICFNCAIWFQYVHIKVDGYESVYAVWLDFRNTLCISIYSHLFRCSPL